MDATACVWHVCVSVWCVWCMWVCASGVPVCSVDVLCMVAFVLVYASVWCVWVCTSISYVCCMPVCACVPCVVCVCWVLVYAEFWCVLVCGIGDARVVSFGVC